MTAWERRLLPFRYQLGDLTLFSLRIPMQVRVVRLAEGTAAVAEPEPPAMEPGRESQGFCIRSLPVIGEQRTLRRVPGYLCYTPLQYLHSWIDLRGSFETYCQKFSARTRSTLKRKLRQYAAHCGGSIPWKTYRTAGEMPEFFRHARKVSSLSYQERLLDAGLPDSDDFQRHMAELAAADSVRAFILFDGSRPVSYLYCPVQDDVLIYAYLGYDPEYQKLSVGTVLQWLAIEELFREARFRFFDFTEGQSEHKRLFATHQERCANVMFMRPTLRNYCLVYSHMLTDRFSAFLGRSLDRLGIKAALRRLLRFGRRSGN